DLEHARGTARELAKPKPSGVKAMPDADFWALIDTILPDRHDEEAALEPLIRALSRRGVARIRAFHEALAEKLHALDGIAVAKNIGEHAWKGDHAFFSVDMFLYARCAVVARGRAAYERALRDPTSVAKDVDLEALLYVPENAYARKQPEGD